MAKIKTKVLVASTDPSFLHDKMASRRSEFNLQIAGSGGVADFLIKEWEPQIVLVDGDSLLLDHIPQIRLLTPLAMMGIIVLSSSSNPNKEERAFLDGSDYYLSSKLSFKGLRLRMECLSKRLSCEKSASEFGENLNGFRNQNQNTLDDQKNAIQFLNIQIYPKDFLVKRDIEILSTTPTQFKLLLAFVSRPEQLLSRSWLKENVWENADISHRSIDAQISKLKRQVPEIGRYLINVYGKGYILTKPQPLAA